MKNTRIPTGWACPVCGRVNAPDVKNCPCSDQKAFNQSGYPEYPDTSKLTPWFVSPSRTSDTPIE